MIPPAAATSRILDALPVEDSGPSTIRIHTPPPARPLHFDSPEPPSAGGMKPLAYLKHHWIMVVFLGGMLGTGLAGLAWTLLPSKYTSTSIVRVNPDVPVLYAPTEAAQGSNGFSTYLKTQAGVFRTHLVLHSALREPGIAELPMLRSHIDPVKFLEEELVIETQEGSELIKLKLSGEDPRAISQILNAIQRVYFREIIEKELTLKKARLRELGDEVVTMETEINRKYDELNKSKPPDANASAAELLPTSLILGQVMRNSEILSKVESELRSLEQEKLSLERRLEKPEEELAPPGAASEEQQEKDAQSSPLAQEVKKLQTKHDYLARLNKDNPYLEELNQEIKALHAKHDKMKKERLAEHRKTQVVQVEKKLKADLERCKVSLFNTLAQREELEKTTKEYQTKLVKTGDNSDTPPSYIRLDIEKRKVLLGSMIDKQKLLNLEIKAPARVTEYQTAAVPQKKEMKKQILGTVMAGLMGFGLVGLLAIVYESRVRRVMSLADVQYTVLGPVLGAIPNSPLPASQELVEESLTKLQSAIAQQFSGSGPKIIVLTSALQDEGKSLIAQQLSETMVRSGARTLLIDFDLRTPILHSLLKVSNEKGLCEILRGEQDLASVVKLTDQGLMFLPAGQWAATVRVALQVDRLSALFQELQLHCDAIIVHTHSILNVAETSLISQFADSVLLCVEKYESRLPMVTRAHEKIAALAPESMGIVFVGASNEECLN